MSDCSVREEDLYCSEVLSDNEDLDDKESLNCTFTETESFPEESQVLDNACSRIESPYSGLDPLVDEEWLTQTSGEISPYLPREPSWNGWGEEDDATLTLDALECFEHLNCTDVGEFHGFLEPCSAFNCSGSFTAVRDEDMELVWFDEEKAEDFLDNVDSYIEESVNSFCPNRSDALMAKLESIMSEISSVLFSLNNQYSKTVIILWDRDQARQFRSTKIEDATPGKLLDLVTTDYQKELYIGQDGEVPPHYCTRIGLSYINELNRQVRLLQGKLIKLAVADTTMEDPLHILDPFTPLKTLTNKALQDKMTPPNQTQPHAAVAVVRKRKFDETPSIEISAQNTVTRKVDSNGMGSQSMNSWPGVEKLLRNHGWEYKKGVRGLHSCCWLRPGADIEHGVPGWDFFTSETELLKLFNRIGKRAFLELDNISDDDREIRKSSRQLERVEGVDSQTEDTPAAQILGSPLQASEASLSRSSLQDSANQIGALERSAPIRVTIDNFRARLFAELILAYSDFSDLDSIRVTIWDCYSKRKIRSSIRTAVCSLEEYFSQHFDREIYTGAQDDQSPPSNVSKVGVQFFKDWNKQLHYLSLLGKAYRLATTAPQQQGASEGERPAASMIVESQLSLSTLGLRFGDEYESHLKNLTNELRPYPSDSNAIETRRGLKLWDSSTSSVQHLEQFSSHETAVEELGLLFLIHRRLEVYAGQDRGAVQSPHGLHNTFFESWNAKLLRIRQGDNMIEPKTGCSLPLGSTSSRSKNNREICKLFDDIKDILSKVPKNENIRIWDRETEHLLHNRGLYPRLHGCIQSVFRAYFMRYKQREIYVGQDNASIEEPPTYLAIAGVDNLRAWNRRLQEAQNCHKARKNKKRGRTSEGGLQVMTGQGKQLSLAHRQQLNKRLKSANDGPDGGSANAHKDRVLESGESDDDASSLSSGASHLAFLTALERRSMQTPKQKTQLPNAAQISDHGHQNESSTSMDDVKHGSPLLSPPPSPFVDFDMVFDESEHFLDESCESVPHEPFI